jgi:hypothetical protein
MMPLADGIRASTILAPEIRMLFEASSTLGLHSVPTPGA